MPASISRGFHVRDRSHPFTVIGVAPAGFFGETLQSDPLIYGSTEQEPMVNGDNTLLHQSFLRGAHDRPCVQELHRRKWLRASLARCVNGCKMIPGILPTGCRCSRMLPKQRSMSARGAGVAVDERRVRQKPPDRCCVPLVLADRLVPMSRTCCSLALSHVAAKPPCGSRRAAPGK